MKKIFVLILFLFLSVCFVHNSFADIIDNADPGFEAIGTWHTDSRPEAYGDDYLYSNSSGDKATWTFTVPVPGEYALAAQWATYTNHSEAVQYTIINGDQTYKPALVSQRINGGGFNYIGMYSLQAGTATIEMTWAGGYACADAVQLILETPAEGVETRPMTFTFAVNLTQQDYDSLRLYRKVGDLWTLHQDFPKAILEPKSDGLYFTTSSMDYIVGDTYTFAATFSKKYPNGAYHPDDPNTIVYEIESALSNTVDVLIEPDPTENLDTAVNLDEPAGFTYIE